MEGDNLHLQHPVKVVVLGAGYAGAHCVKAIEKKLGFGVNYEITVVERRQNSLHKMACARAVALGEEHAERVLVPNDKIVSVNGRTVHQSVDKVTESEVVLRNGEILPFDYLVCATGSVHASVCEPPERFNTKKLMRKFYNQMSERIAAAEKIVIVGGGPPGCELAAEIKSAHIQKSVTIVHSGDKLCSRLSPAPSDKFYKTLHRKLENIGVVLKLGQKLDVEFEEMDQTGLKMLSGENVFNTSTGEKIEADLVLLCAGTKVSTSMYPSEWLDIITGQMNVRKTLQIANHDNIFAVGDLNNVKENKQAATASKQGKVAGINIARLILGSKTLKNYCPGNRTYISLAVGVDDGVSFMGYATFGSKFVTKWKSRDLKTTEMWNNFNVGDKVPQQRPNDFLYYML